MAGKLAPIVAWNSEGRFPKVAAFLERSSVETDAMDTAASILERVRKQGDKAVVAAAKKFDGSRMTAQTMRVSETEIQTAKQLVDDDFKRAAKEAHRRITLFSTKSLRDDWTMPTPKGGVLGERFIPFDRVGACLLYTSPSPRDGLLSRMPSSA